MKFYTHLFSLTPATISINGLKTYDLNTPELSCVNIFCKQDFFVTFFPKQNNGFLPVTTKVLSQTPNEIIKIPFTNNHYNLVYNPSKILQQKNDIVLFEKTLGDIYVKIVSNDQTYINVYSKNRGELLNKKIPNLLNITSECGAYFILKGITKNNTFYILIITNNKIIIEDEFDIMEEDSKNIKLLKLVHDFSKHGTVVTFDKSKYVFDNYSIYENNKPTLANTKELIPLAFMESIKYNDTTLAKYYLKDNFVSNEHISSFFGSIESIYYNSYESEKINYTVKNNEGFKSYNFYIENNKITDIEEVAL